MKNQEAQYNSWAESQKKNRANENVRQESLRGAAEAARQTGVDKLSAESQAVAQDAEAKRLAALTAEETIQPTPSPTAPASVADATLTGMGGGGEVFQTDLAKGLADAAASAKQRIGALATVNSYGGGTFGSLDTVNPLALGESARGIDEANAKRRGSLGAYGVEQAVDPAEITYSNPIADVASSFLSVGAQGLGSSLAGGAGLGGSGLGKIFGGALKPKVKPQPAMVPWSMFS